MNLLFSRTRMTAWLAKLDTSGRYSRCQFGRPWPHTCCTTWSKCSPQRCCAEFWSFFMFLQFLQEKKTSIHINPHPKTGALAGFRSQCMSRKEWTYSRAVKICHGCHRALFFLKRRTLHHSTIQNVKSSPKKEYNCHITSCTVTGPYIARRVYLWLKKSIQEHVAQGSRKRRNAVGNWRPVKMSQKAL